MSMGEIFWRLLNRSITAGWLILVVVCIRFAFRKMPKWMNCVLWGGSGGPADNSVFRRECVQLTA